VEDRRQGCFELEHHRAGGDLGQRCVNVGRAQVFVGPGCDADAVFARCRRHVNQGHPRRLTGGHAHISGVHSFGPKLRQRLSAEGIVAYLDHEVHLPGRSEAGRRDGLIGPFVAVVLGRRCRPGWFRPVRATGGSKRPNRCCSYQSRVQA
jgi:hypothetical protein